jgi:DNA helicase-2/ATP-dependent DNA helicase PcrA
MPFENLIINAAAGAGKTTRIVEIALEHPKHKCLIATYTNNNEAEIRRKFYELNGYMPANVRIQTWFSFLLDHFVRPYQRALFTSERIRGLAFINNRSARGIAETNIRQHYFASGPDIYSDKIAKFGFRCNESTNGAVIRRLEQIADHILIDEVQDLAAWDLDILMLLFSAQLDVTLVGDYRQSTYSTNNAAKYGQYAGVNIIRKLREWRQDNVCRFEEMNHSHRCNQQICDFADMFFADAPDTESTNHDLTGHDGLFIVSATDVESYLAAYSPQILRYDRRTQCDGHEAMNFGESKGLEFNRILIYPHGPLRRLLENADFTVINEPSKLYVAVTRARSSVAFVYDGVVGITGLEMFRPASACPDY